MKSEYNTLGNVPVIVLNFEEEELQPVRDEISKIQNSFESATTANHTLVGNIEQEYSLFDCKDTIHEHLAPLIDHEMNRDWNLSFLTAINCGASLELDDVWVNFMKKHEFNQVHNHGGAWSFVIWMEVPYDIEDEHAVDMSKSSKSPCSGNFAFLYTDGLGNIQQQEIAVDRKYRNSGVLFPAGLHHCVYPFSTSDDYRISISGNYKFKPVKEEQ